MAVITASAALLAFFTVMPGSSRTRRPIGTTFGLLAQRGFRRNRLVRGRFHEFVQGALHGEANGVVNRARGSAVVADEAGRNGEPRRVRRG